MNLDQSSLARSAWMILALGGALFAGCTATPEQVTRQSPLLGAWRSDCTPLGKQDRHGAVFALEFDGQGRMLATTRMFARSDCVEPSLDVAAVADYEMGEPAGSGVAIDYAFQSFEMTLQAQAVADIYNSEAFAGCAKHEWRVGQPQSVLGGFCPPTRTPGRGAMFRDAVFLRDDTVAFGFLPLGLDRALGGERRPTAPSAVVFRKVARAGTR